jgi:hypothetical protein
MEISPVLRFRYSRWRAGRRKAQIRAWDSLDRAAIDAQRSDCRGGTSGF